MKAVVAGAVQHAAERNGALQTRNRLRDYLGDVGLPVQRFTLYCLRDTMAAAESVA